MKKIYFHIYKGRPLDPEDNRTSADELHIHVQFSVPEMHTTLMDWLDNSPNLLGCVQMYIRDEHTGLGILDIAIPKGAEPNSALRMVKASVELFCTRYDYDSQIFMTEPPCLS
ncbi:MAG: hypothetical protein II825_09390 [Paludibacteraceae bacterium]|nr:hypothetical protein [Paludibacteraceae bacterium]